MTPIPIVIGRTLRSSASNRRRSLKVTGAGVATLILAGCAGDDTGNGDGSGGDPGRSGDETGTATGTPGQSVDEVIIGSNHPLSGSLAATGVRISNTIKLTAIWKSEEGDIESFDDAEVTITGGDNQGTWELGG